MDPWLCCQTDVSISENTAKFEFEDNFTPPIINNKLPDSEEYLAVLEKKLRKIKDDPNILAQLAAKREACMQDLLNSRNNFQGIEPVDEEVLNLEEPIPTSQVLRAFAPQKQALNQGEIVDFIKYDQLNNEDSDSTLNQSITNSNIKYRLPLLITVGFMVLDVRMQLDINVQTRRVPRTRRVPPRVNGSSENDGNADSPDHASDAESWSTVEEYELADGE